MPSRPALQSWLCQTLPAPCEVTLWVIGFIVLEVTWSPVGAGLPAMVVNDNACEPNKRGALESIAGKPSPTVSR
ncbi:hypothetical protein EI969_07385 [Pseudomonas sp. PB101]|nr:hypothetical protein [Pseudomonas sp. PB101]